MLILLKSGKCTFANDIAARWSWSLRGVGDQALGGWRSRFVISCASQFPITDLLHPTFLNSDVPCNIAISRASWMVYVGYILAARNMCMVFSRLRFCFEIDLTLTAGTMKISAQSEGKAPFTVKITRRSAKHAELIRRECKEVAHELVKIISDRIGIWKQLCKLWYCI